MVLTRRDLLRAAVAALGLSSVFLLWMMGPVVSSRHDAIYHWSASPLSFFAPPIVEFCACWLLLTVLMATTKGRVRVAIWCGALGLTPWMAVANWALLQDRAPHPTIALVLLFVGVAAFAIPLVLWRPKYERQSERLVEFSSTMLALLAMSGVGVLCGCVWYGWQARSLNAEQSFQGRQDYSQQLGRPRVIWMILDELSYQQVYERRYPGLDLPSFDAVAREATVFTHVIPAGFLTERVVPSLMTGDTVDKIRSTADGRLSIHHPESRSWTVFDERGTVFQDALDMKYKTAIAGWYNPYCRLLRGVLDSCFWTYGGSTDNLLIPRAGLISNLIMPWGRFFSRGMGYRQISTLLTPAAGQIDVKEHVVDYLALAAAADRILDDRSAGFVLIHMPIPHPFGIYNRKSGRLTSEHSNYLDNLVLADQFLGKVRERLENSGQWDSSTVVIMGDHSWRSQEFWRQTPEWTEEEQIASGGEFDDRPGFIVKLAGQSTSSHIDKPFDAKNTRKLLDGLLAQRITSKEELSAWEMTLP